MDEYAMTKNPSPTSIGLLRLPGRASAPLFTLAAVLFSWCSLNADSTAPGALSWTVRYDDENRIVSSINPAGSETRISYEQDAQGRFRKAIRVPPDEAQVIFKYEDSGRIEEMDDAEGAVFFGIRRCGIGFRGTNPIREITSTEPQTFFPYNQFRK
jgi:YD repeat-containing protein